MATTIVGATSWPTLTSALKATLLAAVKYIPAPAIFMRTDVVGASTQLAWPRYLVVSALGSFSSAVTTSRGLSPFAVPSFINAWPDWGIGESPPNWPAWFLGDGGSAFAGSVLPTDYLKGNALATAPKVADLQALLGDPLWMTNWPRVLAAGGMLWLL